MNIYAFSVGSDEACSYLCPNREVNHYGSGSLVVARNCALKKCPDNAPFQSEYGSCFATEEEARKDICYACDAPVPVGLEWNTRLCQRFCPDNRHLEWHNCVLNE